MSVDFDHFIAANEYGFYCVPESYRGRGIPTLLEGGNVYEPNTLRLLRRQIGDGDIITGGSFIGDFFPALHEPLGSNARLYSFEPVPLSFQAAEETIRLNGLNKVHIENVAVGAEPGKMTMLIARRSGAPIAAGERIVADQEADGERHIEIEVRTIDSMLPKSRKVSILHLDVEGFEPEALKGAVRVLNDCRPMVVIEVEKPRHKLRYMRQLNALAPGAEYRVCGTIERNTFFLAQ